MEGAPDHDNPGRIPRGSLVPIWEWISRDLLPTMARDFNSQMRVLIAPTTSKKELKQAVSAFQTKVVKYLENTLSDPTAAQMTRARLATYTSSRSAYGDLVKMMTALRAREAHREIQQGAAGEDSRNSTMREVAKMTALLEAFRKDNADAVPFAIAHDRQAAENALASDPARDQGGGVEEAPPMSPRRPMRSRSRWCSTASTTTAGRCASRLKQNRVIIARDLLTDIYDTEYALKRHIDQFDESEWGKRLRGMMDAIATLVAAEVSRFPAEVGHVLGSRRLRSHDSLAGKLTSLAWKGRDAVTERRVSNGAAHVRKLINVA